MNELDIHCKVRNSPTAKLFYQGLSIGKLLELNWSDIDLKNGTVSVTQNAITVEDLGGIIILILGT
jgi:integrase